ncbi:MAG: CRISPR-associated endonuclease Cas1 [Candidatus Ancillula sp.]|jgi:CRISPR-associated protein Cas1|nr:CRISPR-associated endonuclease Cas1 [Candidatus Ancillula sp.]
MQLYIFDQNRRLSIKDNQIVVRVKDENGNEIECETFPIETVDCVNIFGGLLLTVGFIRKAISRNVPIIIYSWSGKYQGRIGNVRSVNSKIQRKQAILGADHGFSLAISSKIIAAKISNQVRLLEAYNASGREIQKMRTQLGSATKATSIDQLRGIEGVAAALYFGALRSIIPPEYGFTGRNHHPPRDPVNSLLSLGYTLLHNNIIGAIERHGLNPYFGFMHADDENHATLASDLIEEWRQIIVDDTVIRTVIDKFYDADDFSDENNGAVYTTRSGASKLFGHLRKKILVADQYIAGSDMKYGFQYGLDLQLYKLARAINGCNPDAYTPVMHNDAEVFTEKQAYSADSEPPVTRGLDICEVIEDE